MCNISFPNIRIDVFPVDADRGARPLFAFPGLAILLLILVSMTGCGKQDGLVGIKGTVFFDDRALDNAVIVFIPVDGDGAMTDDKIREGFFSARVSPGRLSVKIYSMKEVPVDPKKAGLSPSGKISEYQTVNIIPSRYNEQTTLAIEVDGDHRTFRFDLDSKK